MKSIDDRSVEVTDRIVHHHAMAFSELGIGADSVRYFCDDCYEAIVHNGFTP